MGGGTLKTTVALTELVLGFDVPDLWCLLQSTDLFTFL